MESQSVLPEIECLSVPEVVSPTAVGVSQENNSQMEDFICSGDVEEYEMDQEMSLLDYSSALDDYNAQLEEEKEKKKVEIKKNKHGIPNSIAEMETPAV